METKNETLLGNELVRDLKKKGMSYEDQKDRLLVRSCIDLFSLSRYVKDMDISKIEKDAVRTVIRSIYEMLLYICHEEAKTE